MKPERKRYRAFISYARTDARLASKLHRALERYRVPEGVVAVLPLPDRRLGRFFKDDEELGGSEQLGIALNAAIDDSEALIVVASPRAARSEWVNKEIVRFKNQHGARVLAIIADGTPNSASQETECFPPALRYVVNTQGKISDTLADPPLAPNIATEGFSRAFIGLVSGLLDVEFDTLWDRERRRRNRRRFSIGAVSTAGLLASALVAARAIDARDAVSLRGQSVEVSANNWRFYKADDEFDPGFRAALAAAALDRPAPGESWDLNRSIESSSSALALSGRVLPRHRIVVSAPATTERGNYRDDIPDANPAQRVAIYAKANVRSLAFSENSARLGMTTSDGRVLVFDTKSGTECYSASHDGVDTGSRIALDAAGDQAVVTGMNRLYVINISSRSAKSLPVAELGQCDQIACLHNRWVLATSLDGKTVLRELDPISAKLTKGLAVPQVTTYYSDTISQGPYLFAGYASEVSTPQISLVSSNLSVSSISFDKLGDGVGQVKAISMDSRGLWIALGGNGSGGGSRAGVQMISIAKAKESSRLVGHTGEIYTLGFIPGSELLVTAGSDFSVRLWDLTRGTEIIRLAGHRGDVYVAKVSLNGDMLATASSDGTVLYWDLAALRNMKTAPLWRHVQSAGVAGIDLPSTFVSADERRRTVAYRGRPYDIREWQSPWSFVGTVQSLRLVLVRLGGMRFIDYKAAVRQNDI